jgi:hypothetical protein
MDGLSVISRLALATGADIVGKFIFMTELYWRWLGVRH